MQGTHLAKDRILLQGRVIEITRVQKWCERRRDGGLFVTEYKGAQASDPKPQTEEKRSEGGSADE